MKVRKMCLAALMAALMCVTAPLALPVGPIPITLATLAVYLCGALLGPRWGTAAVAAYLLLGAMGLPVFSGFEGGLHKLVGPTGGYLAGYLICAPTVGLAVEKLPWKWAYPVSMVVGTAALYALGSAWFMAQQGVGLAATLSACVLPFLPGDAVKIAVASLLGVALRDRLRA